MTTASITSYIERLSAERAELLAALGHTAGRFAAPARDGGWNIRQVAEHVADSENFFVRQLSRLLDVDIWSAGPSRFGSPEEAVSGLVDSREMLLWVLKGATDEMLGAVYSLPRTGEFTITSVLEQLASHDRDHAAQVQAIAAAG